jgi:Protein of unknown function (DUF2971)
MERLLVNHEIYFPSPRKFNDPFDCRVPPLTSQPPTVLAKLAERHLQRIGAPLARPGRRRVAKEWAQSREGAIQLHEYLQKEINKTAILSLSEKPDQILMWSHYAAGHTGVCIQFKATHDVGYFGAALPVHYSKLYEEYPILADGREQARRVVLTKSDNWKYESEWRVVVVGGNVFGETPGDKYYLIQPEALIGIIFGCQISGEHRNKLKEWIGRGECKPALYQATIKEREYGLDIKPIS